MSYDKSIEIYEQIGNFVSPLASNPKKHATCTVGDIIIIIDRDVWVRNWDIDKDEQFSLAYYTPEFVRLNPNIFKKL